MVLASIDHSRGVLVSCEGGEDPGFVVSLRCVFDRLPSVKVVLPFNGFIIVKVTQVLHQRPSLNICSEFQKRQHRGVVHKFAVLGDFRCRGIETSHDATKALGVICNCGKVQRPSVFNDFSACQCCRLAFGEAVGVVKIAPITE